MTVSDSPTVAPRPRPQASPSPAGPPPAAPAPVASPAAAPSRRRGVVAFVVTLIALTGLGVAAYYGLPKLAAQPPQNGREFGKGRPMPVVAARVRTADFPVYLDALGTVTALNTVTVRSRVDGEVTKVLYQEGQSVKEGDVLVEIDPRPYQAALQQAQGQLIKDQAQLKNAQADVDRYNAARETVSQQQLDTAAANYSQFQGAIKVDEGAIASAELQLSFCKVTSPITGRIGLRLVDVGNLVRAGDATGLATITQLQPIAVTFNLPEVNLPAVLAAQKSPEPVLAEVFNADRTRRLAAGALQAIDNQIDTTTATVKIKAQFPNEDGYLFPNQFVNVRLRVRTLKGAVQVPAGALQRSPETMFVYAVKPDDTIEMRPVTVGPTEAATTVIEAGLKAGDVVVVEGVDKLAPGMSVRVTGPATRPAATAPATQRAPRDPA